MTDNDISKIAQDIAERFTLDTEPERCTSLQKAISAAILQAATRDDFEARFVAKHGHRLATLLGINAFDLEDRDAQIMAVLAATSDAPSADAVDAQRYRWLRNRENSLETRQYNKEIINGLSCYHDVEGISELKWGVELDAAIDKAIAASAPKGDGSDSD